MTGHAVPLHRLYPDEMTKEEIEAAVESGTLIRVVRGWFAYPTAHTWVLQALRAGGRLGCLSGCSLHGVWTPTHRQPHILVDRGVSRMKKAWHRHLGLMPKEDAVFPLLDCLAQVIRHHGAEEALTVLESAVNKNLVTQAAAEVLIADASGRKQHSLRFFDPLAESGSETRVRMYLQQQRVPVKSQVAIPGVGRVDLLVGESLIIECDSEKHHKHNDEDYRRDMSARALGYTTVRLTYWQIFHDWDNTREHLFRMLRTKQHQRALRPH